MIEVKKMVESTLSKESIMQYLSGLIREHAGETEQDITPTTELSKYGIDSVALVKIIVQIEQHFDIFFEDDEMVGINFENIQVIAERIVEKLQDEGQA
jgi:acyl carrier protein